MGELRRRVIGEWYGYIADTCVLVAVLAAIFSAGDQSAPWTIAACVAAPVAVALYFARHWSRRDDGR